MRVNTAFGMALAVAAGRALAKNGDTPDNWVARSVAEKVDHEPNVGTTVVKGVHVHCRARTRDQIADETGVDVWK